MFLLIALTVWTVLTVIATLNAMRAPVVRDYEVRLKSLEAKHDGLVVVAVSDLHLGTLVSQRWIDARIAQVNALHPDLVAILGDLGEGDAPAERELPATLGLLHTPLGVWSVLRGILAARSDQIAHGCQPASAG